MCVISGINKLKMNLFFFVQICENEKSRNVEKVHECRNYFHFFFINFHKEAFIMKICREKKTFAESLYIIT